MKMTESLPTSEGNMWRLCIVAMMLASKFLDDYT